jgi:hypothetical protein
MVYQISEKNQILLVLFIIVVLCAGKLFKDYLFRRGYIEGLTVIPQTDKILRRPASTGTNLSGVTITLQLTLGRDLGNEGTIRVSWPTGKGVTMSTSEDYYTASIVSKAPTSSANAAISRDTLTTVTTGSVTYATEVTYKLSNGPLNKDSILNIKMENVTINKENNPPFNNDFAFTTTAGSEPSVVTPIIVQPPSPSSASGSLSETSSVQEIRNALNYVNQRITDSTNTAAVRTELIRIQNALISVLANTYGTIKEAGNVFNSGELYEAQKTAMQFITSEKKRAAANAESLKHDNLNKRRMAQINTYYTRNYEANTEVMKNIIFVTIALIVLAVLRNKELIPASIATLGVIFVLTLGGIVIGTQVFDIIRRNDHDFDKYDWNFNEDELNRKQLLQQNSDPANLSEMGMGMAPCYGPGCCNIGTKWNESDKKCVPVGSAVFATGTLTINVNIKVALDATDKITLTLPSGFGQASGATIGLNGGSGAVSLIAPFEVTPPAAINANTIHTITITNLTAPSPSPVDKTLKVKTTNEPTEGSIYIMGI